MRKILSLFSVAMLFMSSLLFSQTYQLIGNPVNTAGWTLIPTGVVNTDFIELTPDQTSKVGGIKLNDPINLKFCDKWKVEFDFRIDGNGTTQYGRGDGFAFWYLANPPTTFTGGGGLGIPPNSVGLMVGFDIFNNTTEGQMSKVHVLYGVNNTAGNNIEYNNTAGSTFHTADLQPTIPFVNAVYRHVEVNGEVDPASPANWIIKVKINNIQVVNQSFAPAGAAATMTQGYFGFAGSTGAASARHSIKNVKVYVDKVPLLQSTITPANICADPVSGTATVNLTSFNPQIAGTGANLTYTYFVQGNPTPIANPSNFAFSANTTINVLVTDSTGNYCNNPDAKIILNINQIPHNDTTLSACQYNGIGIYNLTLANVTAATPVTKKYFPSLANALAGTSEILQPAAYSSASGDVFVRITNSAGCYVISKITLNALSSPNATDAALTSCFTETNPTFGMFDLNTATVTNTPGTTKKFYPSLSDATAGTNEIQNPSLYLSPSTIVYVRVITNAGCYSISKITLTVTPPKYSNVLVDKIICVEDRTTLDAGTGFTSYEWNTGATTQSISGVGVGSYWVLLGSQGCKTKQYVKVIASAVPVISNIQIKDNKVTLEVGGGTPAYQFSKDGITWQSSNVFSGLLRGENTFFVKDSYDCDPVLVTVTVPNLLNVITPNGDGNNDFIDYSALSYKKNLVFTIFDRYGNKLFVGNKGNGYTWDGRAYGRRVGTGTYWYKISWNEPSSNAEVIYDGWILVKNIE